MQEIIDWALKNTKVSINKSDLVVGRYKNKRFRIFPTDGFVGVIGPKGNWKRSRAGYNLEEFLDILER